MVNLGMNFQQQGIALAVKKIFYVDNDNTGVRAQNAFPDLVYGRPMVGQSMQVQEADMRKLIAILLFSLILPAAHARVVTKVVHYHSGDTKLTGFMAYDTKFHGKRPGVLAVHEWWGLKAYARKHAKMLAKLGNVAFALDMYGNGRTASHPKDAGKFVKMVSSNMPLAKALFLAALDQLKANPLTEQKKS